MELQELQEQNVLNMKRAIVGRFQRAIDDLTGVASIEWLFNFRDRYKTTICEMQCSDLVSREGKSELLSLVGEEFTKALKTISKKCDKDTYM